MKEVTPVKPLHSAKHLADSVKTLRDFTTTWRVLPISGLAIVIGVIAAYVAVALLKLIGFFTNLLFFLRVSTAFTPPAGAVWPLRTSFVEHHLGWLALFVPVLTLMSLSLLRKQER